MSEVVGSWTELETELSLAEADLSKQWQQRLDESEEKSTTTQAQLTQINKQLSKRSEDALRKLKAHEDEVRDLRTEVEELHQENLALKAQAKSNGNENHVAASKPVGIDRRSQLERLSVDSMASMLAFAEPTEAEYLRNVLYRYMTERETLGREIVVGFC